MTEEELTRILTDLTTHLVRMRDDRRGSGWPAASGTNAGARATGGKPKLPCSTDLLTREVELHDWLSEQAQELYDTNPGQCWHTPRWHADHRTLDASDDRLSNDAVGWCRWLNHHRHRPLILACGWDLPDLLLDQESEVRHMLYPTHTIADLPTADDVYGGAAETARHLRALGLRVDRKQVTYWEMSGRLTGYLDPDGTTVYSLREAESVARNYVDHRYH